MPIPPPSSIPDLSAAGPRCGFTVGAGVGAAQRAGLGRGLAFALLLAASSLASVYVPPALHGPDWIDGTAAPAAGR